MSETKVFMKDLLNDASLAKRMDAWYEESGITVYQEGDKYKMVDTKGTNDGCFTLEELIEEYEFEIANSKVPKRCVE